LGLDFAGLTTEGRGRPKDLRGVSELAIGSAGEREGLLWQRLALATSLLVFFLFFFSLSLEQGRIWLEMLSISMAKLKFRN